MSDQAAPEDSDSEPSEAGQLFNPARMAGDALNRLPDALGIEAEGSRTCCAVAECFGLCYCVDLLCAIPAMTATERPGVDRYWLPFFAFYEACWPCMRILQYGCCMSAHRRRALRESVWPWSPEATLSSSSSSF